MEEMNMAGGLPGAKAGEGSSGNDTGVTASAAGVQNLGEKEPASGLEAGASAAGVQQETADLQSEFEELIRGKYKAQFDERMQSVIQKRLKGAKDAGQTLAALQPVLERLGQRYGVDAMDAAGMIRAMEAELPGAEAIQAGAAQLCQQWQEQAEAVKAFYPGFDMDRELDNPRFRQLLQSRVDIQTAYEIVHRDEILPAAMEYAARAAEARLARSVAAGSARPMENGMGGQSAALVRQDVSKFTKADVSEIMKRVARGERVSFG